MKFTISPPESDSALCKVNKFVKSTACFNKKKRNAAKQTKGTVLEKTKAIE